MAAPPPSSRTLYRSLLRARMALPAAEVRTQLRFACAAQFRARRAMYQRIRATSGDRAADDALRRWQLDAASDLGAFFFGFLFGCFLDFPFCIGFRIWRCETKRSRVRSQTRACVTFAICSFTNNFLQGCVILAFFSLRIIFNAGRTMESVHIAPRPHLETSSS